LLCRVIGGYIRLNVRGRERDGIVHPNDVEALMREVTEGLATFHDVDGAPVVAAVHRSAEALGSGARLDQLPDLVVEWSARPSVGPTRVDSPRFGTVARPGPWSSRNGNHTLDAWAVIAPGRAAARAQSRPPMITDIAATACGLVGGDMTGLAGEPLLDRA
jgi:predicted AlkP superfamily phosphohydrolase/phosphomutase